MNSNELERLRNYVKKRYSECEMDYQTFNGDIDVSLTYAENKNIIDNLLETLLPKIKTKKEEDVEAQRKVDEEKEAERLRQEAEIKAKLEAEIEKITKDSKELENLYYVPIKYIEMVAEGSARGLLLYGESSLGKSYRVKEVLKRLNKKDYVFISGHITPMRFYTKLYQSRESLVVFDDVNILDNMIILNMIKACLNENSGNVVEYHTTKQMEIPSSFVFNGRVIILLNDIPKRNEHLKAIESRVLKYHLQFSYEEIIKIIFEIANKSNIEGTTLAERLEIAKWIKDNTNRATLNLNIRLYLQAVEFYKWDKENWKELAFKQIQNDELIEMVLQGCSKDEWIARTGMSERSFDRLRHRLNLTRGYNSPIRHDLDM